MCQEHELWGSFYRVKFVKHRKKTYELNRTTALSCDYNVKKYKSRGRKIEKHRKQQQIRQ